MKTIPLKADLHLHAGGDPYDKIPYTPYQLIDHMAAQGYDVIAITNHDCRLYTDELAAYAAGRGVLLIDGMEFTSDGQHILLLNFGDTADILDLEDILAHKQEDNLVVAAHPYFPLARSCGRSLESRPELFDAIEYAHLYVPGINFNRKAVARAGELGLPLLGSSDAHSFAQIGHTCAVIHAEEKTPESVIAAIKAGRVELVTRPVSYRFFFGLIFRMKLNSLARWVRRILR